MSSLEAAITLDDVFTVVEAKRVPLAPELAGYLTLEIADGADAGGGDVDPKTVFISDEGTVALVRPKRDAVTGEAEASIRRLLDKLLDASGSGTPALTAAAKRKPGHGLPALVEELEAALIPVNRAAGRRALARLVREVKRVLLGVGRNAAPLAMSKPLAPQIRPIAARKDAPAAEASPSSRQQYISYFDDEAATAKRDNELAQPAANTVEDGAPEPNDGGDVAASAPAPQEPPPAAPASPEPARRQHQGAVVAELRPEAKGPRLFGGDEVENLLDAFAVSHAHEDKQMARELKAIAGMSPTPPPPDAQTLAELTRDVGKDLPKRLTPSSDGDSVEALLALSDASAPVAPSNEAAAGVARTHATEATALAPADEYASPETAAPSEALAAFTPARVPLREEPLAPATALPRFAAKVSSRPAAAPSAPPKTPEPPPRPLMPPPGRKRRAPGDGPRAPKTGMAMLLFALLVLAGGTVAVWWFVPQVFTGKKRAAPSATASAVEAAAPAPKCKIALVLTDVPEGAEVLLRVGQAPIDVERMPVGTRLELVATAEGYAPRRAVIRADATWEKGPDGKPRIDVPIQLDATKAKPGALDPWPLAEPLSEVGGSGPPGTLHVVSNVRGAEVWLLAGLGPTARIDQLRCDEEIDVLFAGPTALRRRLHVSEQELLAASADEQGNKIVTVSAK